MESFEWNFTQNIVSVKKKKLSVFKKNRKNQFILLPCNSCQFISFKNNNIFIFYRYTPPLTPSPQNTQFYWLLRNKRPLVTRKKTRETNGITEKSSMKQTESCCWRNVKKGREKCQWAVNGYWQNRTHTL